MIGELQFVNVSYSIYLEFKKFCRYRFYFTDIYKKLLSDGYLNFTEDWVTVLKLGFNWWSSKIVPINESK